MERSEKKSFVSPPCGYILYSYGINCVYPSHSNKWKNWNDKADIPGNSSIESYQQE